MLKQIALATLTAVAALVASPSLGHALIAANGNNLNGITLNGQNLNGQNLNGVEPAGREVYFVDEQAGGEGSTVLTIELPRVEPRVPR
jgi:hypothetical protein